MNATRRHFLKSMAGMGTGLVLGCGGGSSQPSSSGGASGQEFRIFVYAGGHDETMRQVFVPPFEAATGARVSLFSGWWDGMTKLKTAPPDSPPFDLMITDATQGYPAAKEGLFAEINLDNVPNHKALAASSLDNWIFEKRVGLPYPDSVMTLAYHRERLAAAPARWGDLVRPEYDGRIGLYNHFYMSLFTFAAVLADVNGRAGTAHDLLQDEMDEVFRFAAEQRPRIKLWWPTTAEMTLALNDGGVDLGNMHSPEYLQALREKAALGAVVPEHDRAMVQVFWAIPAGTKQRSLAEKALDVLFSDEVQMGFTQRGMATPRPDTAARMAEADPLWKSLYPHTQEQFRTLKYYPYDVYAAQWDELADRWDRTVLRQG